MNKKDLIAKLLEKLSEEDLENLLKEEEKEPSQDHKHTIKRRGSGHSKNKRRIDNFSNKKKGKKRRNNNNKGKACRILPMNIDEGRPNHFDNFIEDAKLDNNEQRELKSAAESDKNSRSKFSFKKSARDNNLVDVECCVCGEEESVSASLVGDINRWKCNNCSCQPGY